MISKAAALLALVAAGLAAPQYQTDSSSPIPIIASYQNGPNPDGSYQYNYETGNGIKIQEEGSFIPSADPEVKDGVLSVSGSYSYVGPDQVPILVTYQADENGFRPVGEHIPVPPPIPDGIVRALEWIAAHPEEDKL